MIISYSYWIWHLSRLSVSTPCCVFLVDKLKTKSIAMSLSCCITSTNFLSPSNHNHIHKVSFLKPRNLPTHTSSKPIKCSKKDYKHGKILVPRSHDLLSKAASLYPVYVAVGGVVAWFNPSVFGWFVSRAPFSYSLSLGFIMLSMGVTLDFEDLVYLFKRRPLSILFGCIAQYTIMPLLGVLINKVMRLPPELSVGLVLLACCPGGTASNVVTLIARGDVALSIVMTMCTTLASVIVTPLLTKYLAGTLVPVDAVQLSISTMQVVVAPILLGLFIQNTVPNTVRVVTPFAPLFAVLTSSLLACSVFSENIFRLKTLRPSVPLTSNGASSEQLQAILSSELGVTIISVLLLHFVGFFVGYAASAICGYQEKQRRAVSIEVGMQNSSLGVVLATSHFTSPLIALPAALSAVLMNIMGSSLGFIWRNIDPEGNHQE